ncbi:MAG TPA: hypothetical protein VGK54_18205 [Chloroflexota bacterium]
MTWRLGSCPECHGDLYLDREDENYFVCLQCTRSFIRRRPASLSRSVNVDVLPSTFTTTTAA